MILVIIADPYDLSRAGLKHILGKMPYVDILADISLKENLFFLLKDKKPDVLLLELCYKPIFNADDIKEIKKYTPNTNILVISCSDDKELIDCALKMGVTGYVTKSSSEQEIMSGIYACSEGKKFFCNSVLDKIIKLQANDSAINHFSPLTKRELEVLSLVAEGKSTNIIADALHVSPHTISSHRKSIIRKLEITSPMEFVTHVIKMSLLKAK